MSTDSDHLSISGAFLVRHWPFAALALAKTLVSLWLHQNAMRAMVAERDMRTVSMASNFLESKIHSEQDAASALAMYHGLANGSDTNILSAFVQAHNAAGKNLALVSRAGEILAFSGKAEVRAALAGKSFKPGQFLTDEINGAHYLWLSAAVPKGGLAVNIVSLGPLVQDVLGEPQQTRMGMGDRRTLGNGRYRPTCA